MQLHPTEAVRNWDKKMRGFDANPTFLQWQKEQQSQLGKMRKAISHTINDTGLVGTQCKILCYREYSYLVFQVASYFKITESSHRFLFPDIKYFFKTDAIYFKQHRTTARCILLMRI